MKLPDFRKVAVVVPCFNAELTLTRTLDSVLRQTFSDWSLMAVNDGSTDGTECILQDYAKRYPDKIHYISQKNQGQTVAKDFAIANTESDYVALLDSDDLWIPEKLQRQIDLLEAKPEVGMCYTAGLKINDKDEPFDKVSVLPSHRGQCHKEFIIKNKVVASSVLIRRSVLPQVGSFDQTFNACENWDLWIRIARQFNIEYIDEPLTLYRVHSGNMSKNNDKIFNSRLQVIEKHLPQNSGDAALQALRKTALYRAHVAFAKAYIEMLNLPAARSELLKAINLKPMVLENYLLILKSLLGRRIFLIARNMKKNENEHVEIAI